MADPNIHFILLRADRDLRALAQKLGRDTTEIDRWIEEGVEGSNYLWNADAKAFCARDIRSGAFSNGFTNASALCFFADAGTDAQREATVAHIERIGAAAKYLLPSWDPEEPMFEAQRYWCGPIWTQMNYIAAKGLAEAGHTDLAERIRLDLRAMIEQSGFFECFDPMTGDGCIGTDFSWTAAMWLTWASPTVEI